MPRQSSVTCAVLRILRLGVLEIGSEAVTLDREMIGLEAKTTGESMFPYNLCKVSLSTRRCW